MAKIPRTTGSLPDNIRDHERRLQLLERSRTKQNSLRTGGVIIDDGRIIVGPGGGVVINPGGTFEGGCCNEQTLTNYCVDPKPVDPLSWTDDSTPSGGGVTVDDSIAGTEFRIDDNPTFGYGVPFSIPSTGPKVDIVPDPISGTPLTRLDLGGNLLVAFNAYNINTYTTYMRITGLYDQDGVDLGVLPVVSAQYILGGTDGTYAGVGDWGQAGTAGEVTRVVWGVDVEALLGDHPTAIYIGMRFSIGQPILIGQMDEPTHLGDAVIYTDTEISFYADGDTPDWGWNDDGTSTGPMLGWIQWDEVDHPLLFPPSAHTHPMSQIIGLIAALADKQDIDTLDADIAALIADTSPSDVRDAIMDLLAAYPGLLPGGGAGGWVLAKASGVDLDVEWVDPTDPSSGFAVPPQIDEYASPHTSTHWAKPPDAKVVTIEVLGAGGSGGSGRRAAAGNERHGGAAGAGGGYSLTTFNADDLPDDLYVWCANGPAGAAAVTVDSTDGIAGTAGLSSFVATSSSGTRATAEDTSVTWAGGGAGGLGGVSNGPSGKAAGGLGQFNGGQGGQANLTGNSDTADVDRNGGYNGGGGAGVALSSSNSPNHQGGRAFGYFKGRVGSLRAATDPDPVGNAGLDGSTSSTIIAGQLAPGCGGAGGASGSTTSGATAGGRGGHGYLGGGGGGGGASTNGANSGAGGNGGNGYVRITTIF